MAVVVHAQLAVVAFQHNGTLFMCHIAYHAVALVLACHWVVGVGTHRLSFVCCVEAVFLSLFLLALVGCWSGAGCCASRYVGFQQSTGVEQEVTGSERNIRV